MKGITEEELLAMQAVDISAVEPSTLKDIRNVKIDLSLPAQDRIRDFIRQIGNPYCYRHGKFVVKVRYADNGCTLADRLESYLRSLL